jgi:hypothetical protein
MGFASGFRAGYDVVSAAEERRRKEELRQGLQRESARFTPTEVASGEEALRGFREGTAQTDTFTIPNADGSGGLTVTPAQYEQMYLSDLQQRPAGYMVEQAVVPELGGRQYETLAAAEQAVAPSRAAGLANVYRQAGDVAEAEQLMGLSRGAQLQNLQISEAQRQQDFNTALQDLSTQEFTNPEDRTNATLAVYERFDPKGAVALRSSYTQNQLNEITIDAKKFEKDFTQARAKGLDSVIKWYDSVNDGFTLRRDGNRVIQTDTAGNEQVFAEGTDDEIMMRMDALATPGGHLNLAKAQKDMARSEEQRKLAEAQRLALPAAATGANLDRQIKLAEQLRKQVDDIQKQLENTTPNSKQFENLSKQLDDKNADLYRVTQSVQSGLYSGPSAKVGNTINVRGTTYKKIKSGLDSDQTTWEPVEGGAAAPARGLTPDAAPASSTAPREQAPVPAGIGRMGQSYGRLTPEAIVVEGVRRGDPRAIQEQQRRREIEEAYRTQTPGYNPADVF